MTLPSALKNQQQRSRGQDLGEANADHPYGATSKPMLDERQPAGTRIGGAGLSGPDKQQGDLRDQHRGTNVEAELTEHRTERTNAQRGADVRGPITSKIVHQIPEGLKRERKGPLDKHQGRGETPSQVPSHNPRGRS
jgi:hypothetical protein